MNFVERARLLNRIAHHQDVDGPYALEFDAEGAQNWRDKGGLVLRFQLTQVFDIIWQHLQKRLSFGGGHGLDQELLILGEKEEAAAPAAVVRIPILVSLEYLLSVHHGVQGPDERRLIYITQLRDFSEHILVVKTHIRIHFDRVHKVFHEV